MIVRLATRLPVLHNFNVVKLSAHRIVWVLRNCSILSHVNQRWPKIRNGIIRGFQSVPKFKSSIAINCYRMMTSSNRRFPRYWPFVRWIPQRLVTQSVDVSLISVWINGWVNNGEAGDLRRHRTHCDVTVMFFFLYLAGDQNNGISFSIFELFKNLSAKISAILRIGFFSVG